MTIMSFQYVPALNGRRGLTLIEIMSAITVLAIGLVGVLAAIPFGGFRLAQMNEADYSSLVGKDAVRLIKTNGWANPNNWYIAGVWSGGNITFPAPNVNSIHPDGNLNLKYPFIIDPLSDFRAIGTGPGNGRYLPNYCEIGANNVFYTKVAPILRYRYYPELLLNDRFSYLTNRYDRIFYLPDDLASGFDESEDDTYFRPFLETEDDTVLGQGVIPAFTGRYSWMATVFPRANTDPFNNCRLEDICSADYDVVVFRDRIMNGECIMSVTVEGTGYKGGTITVDLDTMYDNKNEEANGADDRARLIEQLASTKYIMLMGPEDFPTDGDIRMFARWYQIANYSVDADNNPPEYVKMNLIGHDTPRGWSRANVPTPADVSCVFFPGVIGVYSGSAFF